MKLPICKKDNIRSIADLIGAAIIGVLRNGFVILGLPIGGTYHRYRCSSFYH